MTPSGSCAPTWLTGLVSVSCNCRVTTDSEYAPLVCLTFELRGDVLQELCHVPLSDKATCDLLDEFQVASSELPLRRMKELHFEVVISATTRFHRSMIWDAHASSLSRSVKKHL